jgi:hypothetical protein
LKEHHLGFDEPRTVRGNRQLCALNSPNASTAKAKYEYRVIPIIHTGQQIYWLGAAFELEYREGRAYLVNATVLIFQGDAMDPEKIPLLRAEWDHVDNPEVVQHAQPHWHVYAGRINPMIPGGDEGFVEEERIEEFALEAPVMASDSTQAQWEHAQWFHFAMAASWQEDQGEPIYTQITEARLHKWLRGCISYICAEIRYLHSGEESAA